MVSYRILPFFQVSRTSNRKSYKRTPKNTHTRIQKKQQQQLDNGQNKSDRTQVNWGKDPTHSSCDKGCTQPSQILWGREETPSLVPWDHRPSWDPQITEEHGPFGEEGTLPASCPQDCLWHKVGFANAEHGPPCPPGGFGGIPCWPLQRHQWMRTPWKACDNYAKRHAASMTHPRWMQLMAAVKEWLLTKVCSGDGSHSRKGDGWGDNSVFVVINLMLTSLFIKRSN